MPSIDNLKVDGPMSFQDGGRCIATVVAKLFEIRSRKKERDDMRKNEIYCEIILNTANTVFNIKRGPSSYNIL